MSDLLIELVRRFSPSQHEAPAVHFLVDWMAAHGLDAHVDEVGNAVGIQGPHDAPHTLMLLGHIDTVPGEIPVEVVDGVLYGRGSVDAKGPLAAFADATATSTLPDGWRVVVVGAVEEEIATSKGARHISVRFAPDMCIIGEPSGADRITLGYKGRLLVDYTLARPIAHTSRPEPTVGALGAQFWQAICDWTTHVNHTVDRAFDQVLPSLRAINTDSDGFNDTLHMTVGFRLPPTFAPEDVAATVSAFAEPDGDIRAYGPELAYLADKNNALVRGLLAAIRASGGRPNFVLKGGTSDMNVVGPVWQCPIVAYGPGDSNLDHTPHEHLSLAEYEQAITTLRHLIEHLPTT